MKFKIVPLCLLGTLVPFATDIYLPSLISMAKELNVSVHWAQSTIAIYLFFVALSQLICGILSDTLGRYRLLLLTVGCLLIGSLVCGKVSTIYGVLLGRSLQGLGSGGAMVISRAVLVDSFSSKELIKVASYYSFCAVIVLTCAPILGGIIEYSFGWRVNFFVLSGYVGLVLCTVRVFVSETLPEDRRQPITVQGIKNNVSRLMDSEDFLGFSLSNTLFYCCIIAWLTVSPVLLQTTLQLPPLQFGWCYAISGAFFAFGALTNPGWVGLLGLKKTMILGALLTLLAGLMLLLQGLSGKFNLYSIVASNIIMMYGCVLGMNNSFAHVFQSVRAISGTASSVLGCGRMLFSAIISAFIAYFPEETPLSMGISVCIFSLLNYYILVKVNLFKTGSKE